MVFFAAGCSVKEDRDECPCILVMDFSCVDTSLVKSVNVLAESPDGIVFFVLAVTNYYDANSKLVFSNNNF